MKAEMHLFIIWSSARSREVDIIDDLNENFTIMLKKEITWDRQDFSHNLSVFYGKKLPRGCNKEKEVGTAPFLLVLVKDSNPIYAVRRTNQGEQVVNVNVFDSKEMYRNWLGGHNVHSSNTVEEVEHDLWLLLGLHYDEILGKVERQEGLNYYCKRLQGREVIKSQYYVSEPVKRMSVWLYHFLCKTIRQVKKMRHIAVAWNSRRELGKRGIKELKKVAKWKTTPILTQYYTGYCEEVKVFVKVSTDQNYGCIWREAKALKFLREHGSAEMKRAIPYMRMAGQIRRTSKFPLGGGYSYIVADYVDGFCVSEEKMEIECLQKMDKWLERILEEFRELQVIHADIRPQNIMYNPSNDEWKLIDFGMVYGKNWEQEDPIFGNGVLPYALRNTGAQRYTSENGRFDDAYAILQTLKDIYPNYKKLFKDNWEKWNARIGECEIKLKIGNR